MSIKEKILKFWWFRFRNPVIRKGETGGFKWEFRRFWLTVETVSGNFKAKFMADAHPYAYLLAGKGDENIHGFCNTLYMISQLITTDQGLVDDISRAFSKYEKRIHKNAVSNVVEDEVDEKVAIEIEKQIQGVVEMPKKERRKYERGVDGRFKKAVARGLHEKDA